MKKLLLASSFFTASMAAMAQNVGIGTTTPTEKLQVVGNIKLSDTLKTPNAIIGTGAATYPLTVRSTSSGNKGFGQISPNGTIAVGTYVDDTYGAFIQTHTNNDLNFTTNNGGSQMVIKAGSGNVGIGVTLPNHKLEVDGNVVIYQQLQILGGNPGKGKILTSNPNGFGWWEYPSQYNTGFSTYPTGITTITSGGSNQVIPFLKGTTGSAINFDDGNNFSNTTYTYTAPANGVYQFQAYVGMNAIFTAIANNSIIIRFMKNGIPVASKFVRTTASTNMPTTLEINNMLKLSQGDQISVAIYNASGTTINLDPGSCTFSGSRIY